MREQHICTGCGEVHEISPSHSHRLSSGLGNVLVKFRRAIKVKRENSIHLQRDMTGENALTRTEYNNAQKLRYFGLIHHDDEAGVGYWLLTRRGRQFLDGELSVPLRVRTRDNRIIERDQVRVTVVDVLKAQPTFDDFFVWRSEEPVGPVAQIEMFA